MDDTMNNGGEKDQRNEPNRTKSTSYSHPALRADKKSRRGRGEKEGIISTTATAPSADSGWLLVGANERAYVRGEDLGSSVGG